MKFFTLRPDIFTRNSFVSSLVLSQKSPLIFIVGVFLSNFPEAVSSAGTMKAAGLSIKRIMTLWLFTFFATGLGALIGAAIMPVDQSEGFELFVKGMEGFAAGAMLTMIAQTMLPEAFHQVERKMGKREERNGRQRRETVKGDREGRQTREGLPLPCCM